MKVRSVCPVQHLTGSGNVQRAHVVTPCRYYQFSPNIGAEHGEILDAIHQLAEEIMPHFS